MVFSSTVFLFGCLPLTLGLYMVVKKTVLRNIVLLIVSLLFYAWGEPAYILLMLISVFIDYVAGMLMDQLHRQGLRRMVFILSVLANIGMLMYFKYTGFFIQSSNVLFDLQWTIPKIGLPLGISFFTFQAISYLADVYRKKITAQKNFAWLTLYITFFPQLVTGPIVRYETFAKDLHQRRLQADDLSGGLERFIIGLGKKVIIANQMAGLADAIYDSGYLSTPTMWLAAIAYMLQIYFDFSSYSDMALGLARMFGFHFEENFNFPYISRSVSEFWRRWHISLSTWFRDYIYIPLGGNRCSLIRQIGNMFVVWAVTGFWHGAAWNFILWGLYYFIFLMLEKYVLADIMKKTPSWILHIVTLLIVMFGWVLFRADSLQDCITWFTYLIVPSMDAQSGPLVIAYLARYGFYLVLAIIFSAPVYTYVKQWCIQKLPGSLSVKTCLGYGFLLGFFIICVLYLVNSTYNAFIYFKF